MGTKGGKAVVAEVAGYSTATKTILGGNKLKQLDWKANYSIESGIKRTIEILREIH
jgi:hypothetical protein